MTGDLNVGGKFQSCHTMKDPPVDPRKCWASLKTSPTTAFFTQLQDFSVRLKEPEDNFFRPFESHLHFTQQLIEIYSK